MKSNVQYYFAFELTAAFTHGDFECDFYLALFVNNIVALDLYLVIGVFNNSKDPFEVSLNVVHYDRNVIFCISRYCGYSV